jgi:hypothetical protein
MYIVTKNPVTLTAAIILMSVESGNLERLYIFGSDSRSAAKEVDFKLEASTLK